jgi:hypothetical protein
VIHGVSWRPNIGIPLHSIASVGQDKKCIIWTQEMEGHGWKASAEIVREEDLRFERYSQRLRKFLTFATTKKRKIKLKVNFSKIETIPGPLLRTSLSRSVVGYWERVVAVSGQLRHPIIQGKRRRRVGSPVRGFEMRYAS